MTKSIAEKHDDNPAYYDSFSKKIKEALEQYKDKVITEAEYLEKMNTILDEYRKGVTDITYPEKLKNNVHAQAFYGVISGVLEEKIIISDNVDLIADIAFDVTEIIRTNSKVDWAENLDIHKKIEQAIDDLFYEYEKNRGLKLDFDTIDKIIDNVKTVALRRF